LNNFVVRSLSGTVYVLAIIGSLLLGKSLFAAICLLFNILATFELYRFNTSFKKSDVFNSLWGIFCYILFHLYFIGAIEQQWLYALFIVPLVLLSIELYKKKNNVFGNTAYTLLACVYITFPLIILNYLNASTSGSYSKIVLVAFILVWINDTFAYLTGMMFGKHKLFERMTPKKTWEGFTGGVIATILSSWLLFDFSEYQSLMAWLVLGFVIAIASVFGDFVESMFKRNAGVKDSGNLMPGHGGILDRIDSILFVFPVVFVYIGILS
jgi:phosphatidate cytidylyltransferase